MKVIILTRFKWGCPIDRDKSRFPVLEGKTFLVKQRCAFAISSNRPDLAIKTFQSLIADSGKQRSKTSCFIHNFTWMLIIPVGSKPVSELLEDLPVRLCIAQWVKY